MAKTWMSSVEDHPSSHTWVILSALSCPPRCHQILWVWYDLEADCKAPTAWHSVTVCPAYIIIIIIIILIVFWSTLININQSINAEFIGRHYTTCPRAPAESVKSTIKKYIHEGRMKECSRRLERSRRSHVDQILFLFLAECRPLSSGPQSVSAAGCRNCGNSLKGILVLVQYECSAWTNTVCKLFSPQPAVNVTASTLVSRGRAATNSLWLEQLLSSHAAEAE